MNIQLKTVCPEVLGRFPKGEYTVDDGSTAKQALCLCLESLGMDVPSEDKLSQLSYMVNNKHVKADTPLNEGDRLVVLRPVIGG